MKSCRQFSSLSLLALLLMSSPASAAPSPFRRAAPPAAVLALSPTREQAAYLAVDDIALAEFRAARGGTLSLPAPDGTTLELTLTAVDVLAPGATVTYTDDTGPHAITPDITCFRGTIAGDPTGWVALTISPLGAQGVIETQGGRLQLAPAQRPIAGFMPLHALAPIDDALSAASTFECGITGENELSLSPNGLRARPVGPRDASPNSAQIDAARRTFNIAIDCDFEFYGKFASNLPSATNYVIALMNVVSLIYQRDLEATLLVPYLNIWTTVADPYTQATTGAQLPEFRDYWIANRAGVSRSLAHLLSGRSLGGGIAYLDVLCNTTYGYGVSAVDCAYTYPTNTSTWDVTVVAHELGHNFSSFHTHSCNWQALGYLPTNALIDSCQSGEGGCLTPTFHVPPDKGTIMSYCHLLTGGQSNLRLDFHPICIDYMRGAIDAAGCAGTPAVLPPRTPQVVAIPTGARVSWVAGGSSGVTGYAVYRSRTMFDVAATLVGTTSALSFDDTGLGTQYYKVRALRAADTSGYCAEVKLNLCAFATAPNLATGSAPIATVTGDFNEDGNTDLVVANSGASTVSVLLGTGTGAFGAPTLLTTGSLPACLVAGDFNSDGITDLLVGVSADSSLYLHFGNGSAGVGNGTFGAGTRIALDAQPSGIAVADFDEDGANDLVVAGSPAGLLTLRGHLSAGVSDGTFEAPVTVPVSAQTRQVIVGDFNEDGIWDLATTASGLKVLLGQGSLGVGNGAFGSPVSYNAGGTPWDLASADFNLDGIADIAVANSGASSVSMFMGAGAAGVGNGSFPVSGSSVSMGSNPRGLVVGDWNGDGVPDMAVANSSTTAKTVSLATGKGDGTFNAATTSAANTKAWALALGDFNNDAGADLAAINNGTNTATVWLAGCTTNATLGVTSPVGGDVWVATQERAITWTASSSVALVHVELSRDGGLTWQRLATSVPGTSYLWTVAGNGSATARVRVVDAARAQVVAVSSANFTLVPASALGVEATGATRFGVRSVWPNPSPGSITVTFALPLGGAGASLELLDLAGRRVASRELSALAPGVHALSLTEGRTLRPGMYLVRLARPGEVSSHKVAILR